MVRSALLLTRPVVLASSSPRRKQLLKDVGIVAHVVPSNVPEVHRPGELPEQYSLRLAGDKALHVTQNHPSDPSWVIGADTIVVTLLGDRLLEKPENPQQAHEMLSLLSGTWHRVITSYVVACTKKREIVARNSVITKVKFRSLSPAEISIYVESGEPFDKAGGYGIQGAAVGFVKEIQGSYTNVVGLPLAELIESLAHLETTQAVAGTSS
jgi:septum formation protein